MGEEEFFDSDSIKPAPPLPPEALSNVCGELLLRPRPVMVFQLGYRGRYIVLSQFGDARGIHIREFHLTPDGQKYPTKRGVRQDAMQAAALKYHLEEIRNISYNTN